MARSGKPLRANELRDGIGRHLVDMNINLAEKIHGTRIEPRSVFSRVQSVQKIALVNKKFYLGEQKIPYPLTIKGYGIGDPMRLALEQLRPLCPPPLM